MKRSQLLGQPQGEVVVNKDSPMLGVRAWVLLAKPLLNTRTLNGTIACSEKAPYPNTTYIYTHIDVHVCAYVCTHERGREA